MVPGDHDSGSVAQLGGKQPGGGDDNTRGRLHGADHKGRGLLRELIVALKAQRNLLERVIALQRRILAEEKVIDPEQKPLDAVRAEIRAFGA